jgi:hypothetical protein
VRVQHTSTKESMSYWSADPICAFDEGKSTCTHNDPCWRLLPHQMTTGFVQKPQPRCGMINNRWRVFALSSSLLQTSWSGNYGTFLLWNTVSTLVSNRWHFLLFFLLFVSVFAVTCSHTVLFLRSNIFYLATYVHVLLPQVQIFIWMISDAVIY